MRVSVISFTCSAAFGYLFSKMKEDNVEISSSVVVDQTADNINKMFDISAKDSEMIVFVGGQGYAEKDILKEVLTQRFNVNSVYTQIAQDNLNRYVALSGQPLPPVFAQERLLSFPDGFECYPNVFGYEMGAIGRFEGKEVVLIPDNEEECKYIYSTYLEKYLLNNSDSKRNKYVYKLFGARTEEIDSSLKQLDKFKSCSYSYTTDETGDTRIVLKCAPRMSQSTIDEINALLIENFKDSLYSVDDFELQEVAVDLLKLYGRKLSVAESLTGGEIAAKLIDVSGASEVLFEGCVTYSNEAKHSRLLVKNQTLSQFGAVSSETAYQMATGLLNTSQCDVVVATTGIAGPSGGSAQKPVGLTYISVGDSKGIHIHRYVFSGSRNTVRQKAAKTALFLLIKFIKKHK